MLSDMISNIVVEVAAKRFRFVRKALWFALAIGIGLSSVLYIAR
jgi:hypothetical protein